MTLIRLFTFVLAANASLPAGAGLIAPARTSQAVVDKLHEPVRKALASAEVRKRISDVGGEARIRLD